MTDIVISVVLSTYNRAGDLSCALESIVHQQAEGIPYELIVVDNNSTDHTKSVINSFERQAPGLVRYVFEEKQGLSHGRNMGIGHARGRIITFTDDDVRVGSDWIVQIKRALDEHPEVGFIGGKIVPDWQVPPPRWLTRDHWMPLAITDHGGERFYVNRARPVCLIGANLSFRRKVFERVGLFAPAWQRVKDGIGSAEDHEFLLRCWRVGIQGMYVPEIVVAAVVPAVRMTKAYHRRWHTGHGRFCSMMRLKEITGPADELIEERPDPVLLFGTPAFVYRQLLDEVRRWAACLARGRFSPALVHEYEMRYLASYIRQRYTEQAVRQRRSRLFEVGAFVAGMLRRASSRRVSAGP